MVSLLTFCSHSQGHLDAPISMTLSSDERLLTNLGKSFFNLFGSDLSVLETFFKKVLSAWSMKMMAG